MSPRARAYAYHYTSLYQLNILRTLTETRAFILRHQNLNDLLPHISQNLQDNPSHNNNNHLYKYSISTQPYFIFASDVLGLQN